MHVLLLYFWFIRYIFHQIHSSLTLQEQNNQLLIQSVRVSFEHKSSNSIVSLHFKTLSYIFFLPGTKVNEEMPNFPRVEKSTTPTSVDSSDDERFYSEVLHDLTFVTFQHHILDIVLHFFIIVKRNS